MLTCHLISQPDLKAKIFQDFMKNEAQWIVNDLETKFSLQSLVRSHNKKNINTDQSISYLMGEPVLRASELWQKLLHKVDPDWQVLSSQFAQYLVEKWIQEILAQKKLKISAKDFKKAFQTMGQILPLLSHFQGSEALEEWFQENSEAQERWFDWYFLGRELWDKFYQKKMIPQEWMKAVLINESFDSLTAKHYVFDLGFDIDDVEIELIINISRLCDVEVLLPNSDSAKEAYDSLLQISQQKNYQAEPINIVKTYKKLPTMLSEVKEAVSTTRKWIDSGIDPRSIAIVSPVIENYWPTLSEYLMVEGVSFDKSILAPLSQIEFYQNWLSKMRLSLNEGDGLDGEQILFSEEEVPALNFTNYQSSFQNIYDINDFKRAKELKKHIPDPVEKAQYLSFQEFINWSLQLAPKKEWALFSELFQNFDDIHFAKEKLTRIRWFEFFETYLARSEKKIIQADSSGIHVLSVTAALGRPLKRIFMLGLSENNLIENQNTSLHWRDIESIKLNFGFSLSHADRMKMIDRLYWLESKNLDELILTHSEAHFSGRFQAPSLFWLKGAIEEGQSLELSSPTPTRWDELIKSEPVKDIPLVSDEHLRRENAIQRDLGLSDEKEFLPKALSLSASSLEEYFKCPFRFYAQKSLHLTNLPSLDLDVDRMTRGKLIHKICEIILNQNKLILTDDEINELLEESRKQIEMEVYNDSLWQFVKPYYLKMTQLFLEEERQWRIKYPHTYPFDQEAELKTNILLEDGELTFSAQNGIPFRGYIDRIDTNNDGLFAIVDYKSSGNSLHQYTSWIKNGHFQLLLYSLALMEGALGGEKKEVASASYFVMNKFERNQGFFINDADPLFVSSKKTTRLDRDQLLSEFKKSITEIISAIQEGQMSPKPKDDLVCQTCQWNKICRYPKLNH